MVRIGHQDPRSRGGKNRLSRREGELPFDAISLTSGTFQALGAASGGAVGDLALWGLARVMGPVLQRTPLFRQEEGE